MPSARFWHGGRLVAGWAVSLAGFFVLRWVLRRGVLRGVMNGGEVERLGGVWTPEFATMMTFVLGGVLVGVLSWLTGSWIAGRRDRAALRRHSIPGHRRILM
jgi:hypothetical protein